MLGAGVAYSGWRSVELYGMVMGSAKPGGAASGINLYLSPLDVSSIDVIRAAVSRPGWRSAEDISLVAPSPSKLSRDEITQVQFALGYALYPARIWLRTPNEATAAARDHGQRRVILIGGGDELPSRAVQSISRVAHLVELR